jgi:hypothetical protein
VEAVVKRRVSHMPASDTVMAVATTSVSSIPDTKAVPISVNPTHPLSIRSA